MTREKSTDYVPHQKARSHLIPMGTDRGLRIHHFNGGLNFEETEFVAKL